LLTFVFFFQTPELFLPYLDVFTCYIGNGMTESLMEPHLKKEAGASQSEVAFAFAVLAGSYLVTMFTMGFVGISFLKTLSFKLF